MKITLDSCLDNHYNLIMPTNTDSRLDQLRDIKERTKMSQEKIARQIGVSTQTVYRWLKKKSKPLVYLEPALDKFIVKNS